MNKYYFLFALLAICLSSALALPEQNRIAGGTIANITQYPFSVVVLFAANNVNFRQDCGGTVINNRSVLGAAHCWFNRLAAQIRIRAGSTYASSGGFVHNVGLLITHPNYTTWNQDNDMGIIRVATAFAIGGNVQVGSIAGPNYILGDNQNVWAIGWGITSLNATTSEQLRQVQIRTVNQNICQSIYGASFITLNMLCAGWDLGGKGSCAADSGSPLLHNNVVVGVTSFGFGCGDGRFPGVYARVSRFTSWIQLNA